MPTNITSLPCFPQSVNDEEVLKPGAGPGGSSAAVSLQVPQTLTDGETVAGMKMLWLQSDELWTLSTHTTNWLSPVAWNALRAVTFHLLVIICMKPLTGSHLLF